MTRWPAVCLVALCAAQAGADYENENWNDANAQNNEWAYWDTDYIGASGDPEDHNRPMNYSPTGGAMLGYVSVPLANLEPAVQEHGVDAYWPAYPGEFFYVPKAFPAIDLRAPGAAIRIAVRGGHGPGPPVDLGGNATLRFFIGYYDTMGNDDPADDEQAFFCAKQGFVVGNNVWATSTVTLGHNDDWDVIVRDEPTQPVPTVPEDLYHDPQQWGFCIYPVPLGAAPSGGNLGFDSFALIPEPTGLAMLFVGMAMVMRRGTRWALRSRSATASKTA